MNITTSIEHYIQRIKSNPMDFDSRLALIQYYCLDGNWTKALKTIEQYLKINPQDNDSNILFKNNIQCEILRLNVFNDHTSLKTYSGTEITELQRTLFLSHTNEDHNKIVEDYLQHADQIDDVFEISLTNGEKYTGLWLDTDYRFTDLMEIFIAEQYYLLSLRKIKEIKFRDNEYLTDIIWRRAEIILTDGRHISCFIPMRYPFLLSETVTDEHKFSKRTDWIQYQDLNVGQGQKTITNGEVDIGWLDISHIQTSK